MAKFTLEYLPVITLNGKSYNLLSLYTYHPVGTFAFIVAGRVPLKPDDIDEHWIVTRAGNVYIAKNARFFSYHLLAGENAECPIPNWPKLKKPDGYAFIGPTQASVNYQLQLTADTYHLPQSWKNKFQWVPDTANADHPNAAILEL